MAVKRSTRLGCGRDIDDVWDNIHRPPDPHEQTCPDCRAARQDLAGLVEATEQMHTADDADTQLQASPEVLARILDVARTEVRRGRRLPLNKPRAGELSVDLSVSEQAVASVVRRACDRHPLVHLRRCRVELVAQTGGSATEDAAPGTEGGAEAEPSEVTLSLRISVAVSGSIPQVTQDLRRQLEQVIDSEIGLNVSGVEIVVEDVHDV